MNVLITGGTGFIGQHLLEELASDSLNLTVISRQNTPQFWCSNKNFKVLRGDISEKDSLRKAFENTDILINLAAELKTPGKFESTNIAGTKNLVELAKETGVKKIIHLSSVGVVGMQYSLKHVLVDETTPCQPKNEYESTKLEAEKIVVGSGIPYAILRPTNVFGDHHPRQALLTFLQHVKSGKQLPVNQRALVNYVYAKDVAHSILFFIQNDPENRRVNVGQATGINDFIFLIAKTLRTIPNIIRIPGAVFFLINTFGFFGKEKLKGLSNRVEYRDSFMASNILYKYGLQKGLENTIKYYQSKEAL